MFCTTDVDGWIVYQTTTITRVLLKIQDDGLSLLILAQSYMLLSVFTQYARIVLFIARPISAIFSA